MSRPADDALPNLVIAGVTKAGTTSLFRYLGQHPQIGVADVKEVDHYAPMVRGEQPPTLAEYAAHFRDCVGMPWRLEASPRYFVGGPALVSRLADELPSPKVLVSLRDPVARLWSGYTYKHSKGRLPDGLGFGAFVDQCLAVAESGLGSAPDSAFRTLATGVYVDHLGHWFDGLGDDVRVVFFDDLAASPVDTTTSVCAWLGLDTAPVANLDTEARNATVQPRSQALRRAAVRVNTRLNKMLGSDSAVKERLRGAYQKVNAGSRTLTMDPADRERVRAYYLPTLVPLRRMLVERGYTQLPEWLADTAVRP